LGPSCAYSGASSAYSGTAVGLVASADRDHCSAVDRYVATDTARCVTATATTAYPCTASSVVGRFISSPCGNVATVDRYIASGTSDVAVAGRTSAAYPCTASSSGATCASEDVNGTRCVYGASVDDYRACMLTRSAARTAYRRVPVLRHHRQ
jgi:hypothetical protein